MKPIDGLLIVAISGWVAAFILEIFLLMSKAKRRKFKLVKIEVEDPILLPLIVISLSEVAEHATGGFYETIHKITFYRDVEPKELLRQFQQAVEQVYPPKLE